MKSYKRTYIADAANIFVRNLLCEISEMLGGFSERDWRATRRYFDCRCAYTGKPLAPAATVMDHAVAHNRAAGGLHLYGNVVPASREANASKGGKSLDEFFASDAACLRGMNAEEREMRKRKILEFQRVSGYLEKCRSLGFDLPEFLQTSYEEIRRLAEKRLETLDGKIGRTESGRKIAERYEASKSQRLFLWATKKSQVSHKIIAVFLQHERMTVGDLVDRVREAGISDNAYGAVHGMMTDKGHNYGRIFMEENGYLVFVPELQARLEEIKSYDWSL